MHFDAPRLVALRGEDIKRGSPRSGELGRNAHTPRLRTYTQPTQLFLLLEHGMQPTPSLLCGLASWLGACSMYPG